MGNLRWRVRKHIKRLVAHTNWVQVTTALQGAGFLWSVAKSATYKSKMKDIHKLHWNSLQVYKFFPSKIVPSSLAYKPGGIILCSVLAYCVH